MKEGDYIVLSNNYYNEISQTINEIEEEGKLDKEQSKIVKNKLIMLLEKYNKNLSRSSLGFGEIEKNDGETFLKDVRIIPVRDGIEHETIDAEKFIIKPKNFKNIE